jgi:hypothetical protein
MLSEPGAFTRSPRRTANPFLQYGARYFFDAVGNPPRRDILHCSRQLEVSIVTASASPPWQNDIMNVSLEGGKGVCPGSDEITEVGRHALEAFIFAARMRHFSVLLL